MNQPNPGNTFDAPPGILVKRKRGRPRKDRSLNRVNTAQVPPGFQGINNSQPHPVEPSDVANDKIVGEAVSGVVEAAFDAGYLLTVRIGNSDTSLRGVVFKPGHYIPISAENDVAPNVQMIRRNETPHRMDPQVRAHGRLSRGRNKQHRDFHGTDYGSFLNGLQPANQVNKDVPGTAELVAMKGKSLSPPVAAYSVLPVGSTGTAVPVVLQPVHVSNELPPAYQVPIVATPLARVVPSKHDEGQTAPAQRTLEDVQNYNDPSHRGAGGLLHGVSKPMKPTETSTVNGAHIDSSNDSCQPLEEDTEDMNEPLFVEPLRAIHSGFHNQSSPTSKPLENRGMGRMSELLLVLQDNMTENEEPRGDGLTRKSDAADVERIQPKA